MYGFNGKENDNESKTQDYGMRIYNPSLGRFLSVDPITDEYPELTPYQFASNRPIDGIDLDGLEWVEAEIAVVNGKTKFTISSWDDTSPIGITYSDFTVNIRYAENGQHYRFTTAPLSGFWSIFSSASGRENEFFPKFDAFIKDPVGTIKSGYVTSVEQEFMGMVSEYGQLEMLSPSPARGTGASAGGKAGTAAKPSPAANTNKQATAANKGNTNAATSNTATSPQPTPSKVSKSTKTESIGGGKYTKTTEVRPSKKQPGQSRAEYVKYKNKDGKTIKMYKDSYDRGNKFQHRKHKPVKKT